tara:strand:- start:282 stop:500 length:219 start_codon:yes stop_codon:yes gene_type:complete
MKTYVTQGYSQVLVGTIAELIKWIEEDTGCNVSYDVDQHSNPILVGNEVYRDENGFTITLHECLIIANEVKG